VNSECLKRNSIYLGVFLIALATTALELLLPRIWSVTMWYHFAFVAISLAMFGITSGAIVVFLFPSFFSQEQLCSRLALGSLLFGLSIVLSFLTQLSIPFFPDVSIVGFYSLLLICLLISIPFMFSGIVIALAMTRFPYLIGNVYASDLCGAAFGCVFMLWSLSITDGPTAVIATALFASIGALLFAKASGSAKLKQATTIATVCLALLTTGNTILASKQHSLLRPLWVKAQFEARPLYEKWNSFSRIAVSGNPEELTEPLDWGLSPTYSKDRRVRELHMDMDAYFATLIPHFSGDFKDVDYLKYDLTNLVYFLRSNARVLIIGMGGGRDVLSALALNEKSVIVGGATVPFYLLS